MYCYGSAICVLSSLIISLVSAAFRAALWIVEGPGHQRHLHRLQHLQPRSSPSPQCSSEVRYQEFLQMVSVAMRIPNGLYWPCYMPDARNHIAPQNTLKPHTNNHKWGPVSMTAGIFYAPPSGFASGPNVQGKTDGTSHLVHSVTETSFSCVLLQIRGTQRSGTRRTWDRKWLTTPLPGVHAAFTCINGTHNDSNSLPGNNGFSGTTPRYVSLV